MSDERASPCHEQMPFLGHRNQDQVRRDEEREAARQRMMRGGRDDR